jgi:hypothetical protein
MSSKKKIDANQRNAQCSTGPRTPTGKRTSSRNSLKHGLFSRELRLTDEDKPEFEKLRRELTQQLPPKTALQQIALDQAITCAWRCKVALRVESQQLARVMDAPAEVQTVFDEPSIDAHMLRWFGSGRADLNAGIRLLAQLRDDIRQQGTVQLRWQDPITACFGADFYKTLREWAPMNPSALQLARHLESHSKSYAMPLPATLTDDSKVVFVRDPQQERQMLLKLVDQGISFLDAAKKIHEEGTLSASVGAANVDFASRYVTNAMRELQRALHWLLYLMKEGL